MKAPRNSTYVNLSLTKEEKNSSDFYYVNFIGTFPSFKRESGFGYICADSHITVFLLLRLSFPYLILKKK